MYLANDRICVLAMLLIFYTMQTTSYSSHPWWTPGAVMHGVVLTPTTYPPIPSSGNAATQNGSTKVKFKP